MTAASANKVTVPGDNRLDELKLGNKTPFWHKIPIIKELRVAVGWQKGMLITGLVLTAFFLLVAIFAPLIAPYSYAQLKGADGVSFPAQAAPSSEHIWGTTAGGYDVFSRVVWGARTAVIAIVVSGIIRIVGRTFNQYAVLVALLFAAVPTTPTPTVRPTRPGVPTLPPISIHWPNRPVTVVERSCVSTLPRPLLP